MIPALLLASTLLSGTAHAQTIRSTNEWVFPSGLRVVILEDHRYPVSHVATSVHSGSSASPADTKELAHLTEHLWFYRDVGGRNARDVIDRLGCQSNASTSDDVTIYQLGCTSDAADEQLALALTVLQTPWTGLDEDEIASSKRTVAQEARLRTDRLASLWRAAAQGLFGEGHPYHEPEDVLGAVQGATLEQVGSFVSEHYRYDEAVLAVHGDVPPAKVAAALRTFADPKILHPKLTADHLRSFGAGSLKFLGIDEAELWFEDPDAPGQPLGFVAAPEPVRITEDPPLRPAKTLVSFTAPVERPFTAVAYSIPASDLYTYWPTFWLSAFAEADIRAAVAKRKEVRDAWCMTSPGLLASTLVCVVEHDEEASRDKLEAAMLKAFGASWSMPREDAVKASGERYAWRMDEGSERDDGGLGTTVEVARHLSMVGHPMYYARKYKRDVATEVARYRTLSSSFLVPDRAVRIHVDPGVSLDDDGLVLGEGGAGASPVVATEDATDPTGPLLPVLDGATSELFDNGFRFVTLPRDGLGMSRWVLSLRVPEGFPKELPYLVIPELNDARTKSKDSDDWRWGAPLSPGQHLAITSIRAGATSDPGGLVKWVATTLGEREAMKPTTRTVNDRKLSLLSSWRREGYWMAQAVYQTLAGTTAPLGSTPDDVDAALATSKEDLERFVTGLLRPEQATLVVAGKFNEELPKRAEKMFGKLAKPEGDPPAWNAPKHTTWTGPSKVFLFPEPEGAATASVDLYCPIDLGDRDDRMREALGDIASTLARGRAYAELREARGIAYTPSAYVGALEDGDLLVLGTDTPAAQLATTIATLRELIATLATKGPSDAELRQARNAHVQGVRLSVDSNADAASFVTPALAAGVELEQLQSWVDDVLALGAADAKQALTACSGHEVAIVTGAASLEATLRSAGLDPVVVDWKADFLKRVQAWFPARLAKEKERL
ncbi:MAG: insulinase family protein [Alphaproteobacteria bacterium]|nr:insulinase family protein [Alphaproteobacteria bacterium]